MILYRYIIKEHIYPFLVSLSIIIIYFIMEEAVQLLNKIVSKGLDPAVVLEVFLIQLGWIIALAIPMAILTATLWTFGRMSGDNEITSIKASGQNMLPLLMPVFAAGLVFTVLLVFFNELILPDANHRVFNLLSDISRKKPAALIEPRVLIRDFANYTLYADDVNPRTGDLKGLRIFSDMPGQDPSTTVASRGILHITPDEQYLELTLYDGETHTISRQNGKDYYRLHFGKQVVFIKNVDTKLERTNSSYRGDREMSSAAMFTEIASYKKDDSTALQQYRRTIDSLAAHVRRLNANAAGTHGAPSRAALIKPANFGSWAAALYSPALPAANLARETGEIAGNTVRRIQSNDTFISQYMVEIHKKYAIAVACLVFVLIGAPLGIMARRGGLTVGASYSIFFFIAYWAFLMGGESLGDKMIVSPAVAMWSGNAVIGLCGVVLMILMLRETTIRFDRLLAFWKKIGGGNNSLLGRLANSGPGRLAVLTIKLPKWLIKRGIGTLPMYLISLFTGYTLGLLFALIAVAVVIDYFSNMRQFEQASFYEIGLYYWNFMPWLILMLLPIVALLGSMFAIGKMAKHSEIIAMKAAGIGIRQLTFPLLALGIVLSIAAFYGGEKILPQANQQRRELTGSFKEPKDSPLRKHHGGKSKDNLHEFRRNFYYFGGKNSMYVFQEFNTAPQLARGIWRESFDTSSIRNRVQAESMVYDSTGWRFIRGTVRRFSGDTATVTSFDTLRDSVLAATPSDMVARIKDKEEMSYWELKGFIDAAKRRGEQVRQYLGDLEFKIALPFMNFIVILLGVAITARAGRKGFAVFFGIGIALAFTFWLLSRFTIVFAQNGYMPILVGAWIGNVLFLVIGFFLYLRASR